MEDTFGVFSVATMGESWEDIISHAYKESQGDKQNAILLIKPASLM